MSSRIPFLLSLLSFSLLLYAAVASDPLLAIRCSSSNTLRPGYWFARNLHQLMYLLSAKAPAVGFEIGSVGSGPSRAFGLALCRGDVTRALCHACIRTANAHALQRCPRGKRATVWLDRCMVRYSDSDFFGEVDRARFVLLSDRSNASADPPRFDSKVVRLMKGLTKRAYLTPLLYAAGELVINNHNVNNNNNNININTNMGKLYGLVQCSKDLSGGDCKACLDKAISQLSSCCKGKRGGRVLGSSCNLRYEVYPFFDA